MMNPARRHSATDGAALPTPAAPEIRPRLWFWREVRMGFFHLAIARQHPLKTRVQRGSDVGALLECRDQEPRRLDGRQRVAARLAAEPAITRRLRRIEDHALAFQHPGIAPPQRLGLAPGAVEHDHALDAVED